MRRSRKWAGNLCAVAALLWPGPLAAETFCDQLRTIVQSAPDFDAVRGDPVKDETRAAFHGTISLAESPLCVIINQTGENKQIIPDRWEYTCIWNNRYPESEPWMVRQIAACYPDASFFPTHVADDATSPGGVYTVGDVHVSFYFDSGTKNLFFTVSQ